MQYKITEGLEKMFPKFIGSELIYKIRFYSDGKVKEMKCLKRYAGICW